MLQCLWCCKFRTNCFLMIFIVRNDLLTVAFITIKIIMYNVFNSSPTFSLQKMFLYLVRGCYYIVIKQYEVFECDVILSRSWIRRVASFSSISLYLQVLLASDFLKPHFKQWTIVSVNTSFQATCNQWIVFAILTSCIIPGFFLPSWIWNTTYFRSLIMC